jgi:hypothetical protein
VGTATDGVIQGIVDSLGTIPTALNTAITTVGNLTQALDAIPDESVNININTNYTSSGSPGAAGGGGGPGSGASGPGGIWNDPGTGQPVAIGPSGSAGGGEGGTIVPGGGMFALGGMVPGPLGVPTFGNVLHGGEMVLTPSQQRAVAGFGINEDRLAAKIAAALASVSLAVSVDDIHTGLLKKQARNRTLGLA